MKKHWKLISFTILISSFIYVANLKVHTQQCINGTCYRQELPIYAKLLNFIIRHKNYQFLLKQITQNSKSEQEKIEKVFNWTNHNIKVHNSWEKLNIIDDHVWNIIIRGYGTDDQSADVFTTLCTYLGYKSVMARHYSKNFKKQITTSLVYINGRWTIFDTARGNIFRKKNGDMASIDDLIKKKYILNNAIYRPIINQLPYKKYFEHLYPLKKIKGVLKPTQHNPFNRLVYELKKQLGMTDRIFTKYPITKTYPPNQYPLNVRDVSSK